jgi:hypothetical protein
MDPLTLQMKKLQLMEEDKTEQMERQFEPLEERRKKERFLRWRPVMPAPPWGGPGTICFEQPRGQVRPDGEKSSA